ncbi:DUF1540 domain-containing protein [Paenibacillus swuensis]
MMENPKVKCSVDNCSYWEEGNNCVAETIMIEINAHAHAELPEGTRDEQYDSHHTDHAAGVKDTCCHTFKERVH